MNDAGVDVSLSASIVIVNYNAGEKLAACLDSVLCSISTDCEVIVIDNASSDGMADRIEAEYPAIVLFRSAKNLGFGGACNLGTRHARGRFVVFLNPDTVVRDGWLEALLAPFETNPKVGLITAKILLMDESNRINACGCDIHVAGLILCRGAGRSKNLFDEPCVVGSVSGAAFSIRSELFAALGGFDEDMFLYCEDADLSWRAGLLGWRTLYTPDSIVLHDYRLRMSPLRVFWNERNRYLMLLKTLRVRTLVILLPAYFLAEALTWGYVLLSDRDNLGNKIAAYKWIASHWNLIMTKRRQIQARRVVSDREMLKITGCAVDFGQASGKTVATLAGAMFNPVFFVLRLVALGLVWW